MQLLQLFYRKFTVLLSAVSKGITACLFFFRTHTSSHSCSAYQWHFGRVSVKNVTRKIFFLVAFLTSFYFCEKNMCMGFWSHRIQGKDDWIWKVINEWNHHSEPFSVILVTIHSFSSAFFYIFGHVFKGVFDDDASRLKEKNLFTQLFFSLLYIHNPFEQCINSKM